MEQDKQIEDSNQSSAPRLTQKPKEKSTAAPSFQLWLIIILVILGIIGLLETWGTNEVVKRKSAEAKEAARPANLEIITITDKNCADCSSLTNHINLIKNKNAQVEKETNLDLLDQQAQELIREYKVKKIPFMIISGEINKNDDLKELWAAWGGAREDKFLLTNVFPPYLNLDTKEIEGRVSVTYLTDQSCLECYDVMTHKDILERSYGIKIISEKTLDIADQEGKELLEKYNITQVPTFLADNEIAVYQGLQAVWQNVGSVESAGTYVFRKTEQLGNYYDLTKKEMIKPATSTNTNNNQ